MSAFKVFTATILSLLMNVSFAMPEGYPRSASINDAYDELSYINQPMATVDLTAKVENLFLREEDTKAISSEDQANTGDFYADIHQNLLNLNKKPDQPKTYFEGLMFKEGMGFGLHYRW